MRDTVEVSCSISISYCFFLFFFILAIENRISWFKRRSFPLSPKTTMSRVYDVGYVDIKVISMFCIFLKCRDGKNFKNPLFSLIHIRWLCLLLYFRSSSETIEQIYSSYSDISWTQHFPTVVMITDKIDI